MARGFSPAIFRRDPSRAERPAAGRSGGPAALSVPGWEDCTQTAVDPGDDCTIWYVGDYVRKGAPNYSSRIGAFRLTDRCR